MQPIPAHLLLDHLPKPIPEGNLTVQDLIKYVEDLLTTIEAYRLDKAALRELAELVDSPNP